MLDRELDRRGIYPPVRVLPSLSRLMNAGTGAGFTHADHPALANQLFACYARATHVRVLASVMGEESLPEVDRRFLAFGRELEERLVNQQGRRTLEESMSHRLGAAARPAGRGTHAAVRSSRSTTTWAESRMPEAGREITATRIALLELKDEQRLVREGYELLDEKRILLAHEIRRQLARLAALRRECAALESEARARTMAAVGRHGLDELSVYPPLSLAADRLGMRRSRLLGLELLECTSGTSPRTAAGSRTAGQSHAGGSRLRQGAPQLAASGRGARGLQREFAPPRAGLRAHRAPGEGHRECADAGNRIEPQAHRGTTRRHRSGGDRAVTTTTPGVILPPPSPASFSP